MKDVVRRYRRDGYRVTVPGRGSVLPAFLGTFVPDLIAENEIDRVVVEIRRSNELSNSNSLAELSERVSKEPGWRYELVTIAPDDAKPPITLATIEGVSKQIRRAVAEGELPFAMLGVLGMLDFLLEDIAVANGIDRDRHTTVDLARELAVLGAIATEIYNEIRQAVHRRDHVIHRGGQPSLSADEIERVIQIAPRLFNERALLERDLA